ncbi:MAG: PsbP-related protein [Candidatus Aureabacteria bacterium]|nr:PsbP-related protein [Candidatus Auribacterota bacterium]
MKNLVSRVNAFMSVFLLAGYLSPCIFVLLGFSSSAARAGENASEKVPQTLASPAGVTREYMSKAGYRIVWPEGWVKNDTDIRPLDVAFFCRSDPGVNISVTWAPAGGEAALTDAAAKEIKEMFRQSYPGYDVTAEEWRTVDGAKAYCLSARYARMDTQLHNKQVMFIKGGKFFTISYTSTPALFMKYLEACERTVGSFRTVGGSAAPVVQSPQPKQ